MSNKVLLALAFIYSLGVGAQERTRQSDVPSYVVKTRSGICNNKKESYEGTGEVFKKDGKTYVLVNEHSVLHGNDRICHTVESPSLKQTSVTLLAPDVGEGVALMKMPDNTVVDAPDLKDLFDLVPLQNDEDIRVDGYAYDFTEPASGLGGHVYQAKSPRHRIPNMKHAVEIIDGHVEPGDSGGRAARPKSSKMAAMVSHQYLERVPNAVVTMEFRNAPKQREVNHVILIPAQHIQNWVIRYFENPQAFKAITRDPDLQVFDVPAFFFEGLMLKLVHPPKTPEANDEKSGITNAGGGEGVKGSRRRSNPVWVQVEKDPNPQKHLFSRRTEVNREWVKKAHSQLELADTKLEVRALVERSTEGDLEMAMFEDLGEFMKKLNNPRMEPSMIIPERLGRRLEEKTVGTLVSLGKTIRDKASALIKENEKEKESADAQWLLQRIVTVGELLMSDWEMLKVSDIKRVMSEDERNVPAWDYLLFKHRTEAPEILRALITAGVELDSVTP